MAKVMTVNVDRFTRVLRGRACILYCENQIVAKNLRIVAQRWTSVETVLRALYFDYLLYTMHRTLKYYHFDKCDCGENEQFGRYGKPVYSRQNGGKSIIIKLVRITLIS